MKLKRALALLPLLFSMACAGAAEPQAILRIVISPAAYPVSAAVMTCAPASEDLFVSIDSYYPRTFELADYDVFVQLGEPPDGAGFVAQIASEEIVAVANLALALNQLSRSQAADLFSGRVSTWDEITGSPNPVVLWVGPQSDEARRLFTQEILLGSPVFSGAFLAASPEQVLAEIGADANAVGILPAAWADETVQAIDLGIATPVLAVTATEPSGPTRDMLACLQSETGQSVLGESYERLAE